MEIAEEGTLFYQKSYRTNPTNLITEDSLT